MQSLRGYPEHTPSIVLTLHLCNQVKCNKAGPARESLDLLSEPLPATLDWGEVLVSMQYAPINPADLYTARTGGVYGDTQSRTPFIIGHDGVGLVTKVNHHLQSSLLLQDCSHQSIYVYSILPSIILLCSPHCLLSSACADICLLLQTALCANANVVL